MGFFTRASDRSEAGARATGLVIEAEAPPQGAPPIGTGSHGIVRVLVDGRSLSSTYRFKEEHWLVRGMDVPVLLDPARPGKVEIEWDAVPSMEDRVAANDPALADPFGAGRRVAHALGLTRADTGSAKTDHFNAAMERAAQTAAPAGRLRAVVIVASHRGRYESGGDPNTASDTSGVNFERNSAAVLAVNVPGVEPYAVFVRKFKYPRFHRDLTGGGLPALVAAADPEDIEVLWSELGSVADQVASRISDAGAATGPADAMQQQMLNAMPQSGADAAGAIPPSAAAALQAMAPQMRELATESARRALMFVQDPAQREMLLAQYRAAGIDVGDADKPG
jgi:hypothetical protein